MPRVWNQWAMRLGIGWSGGLLVGLLCASSAPLQDWERMAHQGVTQLRQSAKTPNQVVLVRLRFQVPDSVGGATPNLRQAGAGSAVPANAAADELTASDGWLVDPDLWLRASFHTVVEHLVPMLIEQEKAQVVALMAPPQWPPNLDPNRLTSLTQTIDVYADRLVLASPVSRRSRNQFPDIDNYLPILPFDSATLQPKFAPQMIQGYWEKATPDPLQTVQLVQPFTVLRSQQPTPQMFRAMPLLLYQKWQQAHHRDIERLQHPLWVPIGGPAGTVPTLDWMLPTHCQARACFQTAIQRQLPHSITGKIVLIEAVAAPSGPLDISIERTPMGDLSAQEVQANVLASLMQGTFTQEVILLSPGVTRGLVLLIALCWGGGLIAAWRWGRWLWLAPPIGLGGYALLYLWAGWQGGWLLPLVWPLSAWLGTCTVTAVGTLLWHRDQQFQHQARELDRLRGETEEHALVLKTKTLLHRIACDIHGGPLQELKVALFQVENLQRQSPNISVEPILTGLVDIGHDIRHQLSNIEAIATKLRMTPQLRDGLHSGIETHLDRMIDVGRLQLRVVRQIQPLVEPELNTLWIAAREDIFRFFREAMQNVVCHAQPEDATQVTVRLAQAGEQCWLAIANNGTPPTDNLSDPENWGRGSKEMAAIAHDLPEGQWSRFSVADEGFTVELRWQMQFTDAHNQLDTHEN